VARLKVRDRSSRGFWRALEALGVKDARTRWERQSSFVQRAVPPLVTAALVMLVAWGLGVRPHPTLIVLLGITYALYLMPRRGRRIALPVTVFGLAVVYPILWVDDQASASQFGGHDFLFAIPIFNSLPNMDTMVAMVIFAMMALGLNMVVGYAGLLDLGYVAFYAIGAYTSAWLASPHFASYGANLDVGGIGVPPGVGGIHFSIWIVLVAAAIITAVGGVLIGLPTLRLRGDYLAIVTLGFGEIVHQAALNGDQDGISKLLGFKVNFDLTNGAFGINPVDPPGFGDWLSDHVGLPANFIVEQGTYVNFVDLFYWSALALLLITLFCSIRLRDSRLGRAWIAIREDEVAAAAMGIPLMRTKTWAYASGAFVGGVAGAFYGSFKQGVFPDDFLLVISIFILCMVVLGGMGNVWGVLTGAAFLTYLNQEGLANTSGWFNERDFGLFRCDPTVQDPSQVVSHGCLNAPLVQTGIYGAILVLVMLFRPQGLIPEARRKLEFETGVHDEPLMDVRGGPGG
jgi:branched-chain amino acid transport system permease protein